MISLNMHREKDALMNKAIILAIALLPCLSAFADPAENSRSAYFSEVIMATQTYKIAVETCYQTQGGGDTVKHRGGGEHGVPANITGNEGNVGSVTVSDDGVITATGSALHGLAGETYILTPVVSNNTLTWNISGSCSQDQLC